MMAPLLHEVELTPGQLSELRAIDAFYYTQLALQQANESDSPSNVHSGLDDRVIARVRDMLDERQRATFDRNRDARRCSEALDSDRIGRRR